MGGEEGEGAKEVSNFRKKPSGGRNRPFTAEEDRVLVEAIQAGRVYLRSLARRLARNYASVRDRVIKLRASGRERLPKVFTLEEDMVILDMVVGHLREEEGLATLGQNVPNFEWFHLVESKLGQRRAQSLRNRRVSSLVPKSH